MRRRSETVVASVALLAAGIATGWAIGAARTTSPASTPVAAPPPPAGTPVTFGGELVSYNSCSALLDALRERGRAIVGPYGLGRQVLYAAGKGLADLPAGGVASMPSVAAGPALRPAEPSSYSVTNTQVPGVDEPDVVKTNGRIIVSVDGQRLHIIDVNTQKVVATLALPHPGSELLLAGDRVVVLSGEQSSGIRGGPVTLDLPYRVGDATTTATIVDIADPAHPQVVRSFTFDAGEIAARVVGGTIRLVLRTSPPTADWVTPRDGTDAEKSRATKANQSIVDALPLDSWLPHWTADGNATRAARVSACGAVAVPEMATTAGLVTVLSLDPQADAPGPGTSVFGPGATAYAEGQHLYIAGDDIGTDLASTSSDKLRLLEFDISDPAQARFLASGTVPGQLHDSYALSEYQDRLRVTTTNSNANGATTTAVTVLERQGDTLTPVGKLDGLGAGEQVYAVRYLGDRGYVVTFRQVDPVHVIDLSDPKHPALRGTLSLAGYSSLLQPLPNDQLLGIGRSVSAPGMPGCPPGAACPSIVEPNGVQISLFDVADPAHPRLVAQRVLNSYTDDGNAHALTADPAGGYFLLPSSSGPIGIHVDGGRLRVDTAAAAAPYNVPSDRAVFAAGHVFELTDRGVAVRNPADLKQTGWLAF